MSAKTSRIRRSFSPAVLALVALVLVGGGVWGWRAWSANSSKNEQFVFATVQKGDIEDLVGATGALQPRDYVDVGAQVSGQLQKLLVDVGSVVKKGDLLAEIDATQSAARVDADRAALRSDQATLADKQAALDKAQRDLQRQKNLMAEEATTAEQVQNAETALRSAKAQLASLQAQIQQQQASMRVEEANLKYAKIYAPMAGTVISVAARQGQTLNAAQSAPTILRIADLSTMTVQTQVSEADVGKLRIDMPSYFTTLGSGGRRYTGTLRKIEPTPTVTNNVVLYNALFDVPNPGNALLPQMTAQVFFVAAEAHDVLMVPVAALTFERTQRTRPSSAAAPAAAAAAADAPAADIQPAAVKTAAPANADTAAAPKGDRAAQGTWRRNRTNSAATPRNATVKVAQADGTIVERAVTVGVSNRVNAQVLSGLEEGERVVVGQKLPDAPKNQQQQQQRPLGAPAGMGGAGGGRR